MSMDRRRTSGYVPLRDAVDRLFAGSFIMPEHLTSGAETWPPTNLRITEDDVVLCMAIPGADPDDINVSVTGDTVTVSGEVSHVDHGPKAHVQEPADQRQRSQTYIEEIWHGKFQRSFILPIQVDANKAAANYEHGILTLTLPKSETTKPRKVQVRPHGTIEGTRQQTQASQVQQGGIDTETVPVESGGDS
ncbi:MAG: hypothetical protein NVSMB52_09840 [Chloroflexota bacterium]